MRTRPALSPVAALVSVALCAAATSAETGAERAPAAAGEGGLTLTMKTPTGQPGHWAVEFEEKSTPSGAAASGVGSLSGAAEVDCAASQFKLAKYKVFEGAKFTGAVLLDLSKRVEWRSPEPGTTMDRVLAAACGRTKVPARERTVLVASSGLKPPTPTSTPTSTPAPAPSPPPAASGPPARAAAAKTAAPSAPAHAPAVAVSAAASVASSVVPSAAPSVVPAAAGGDFFAQLASLPSEGAARHAWDQLKGAAPPGVLDDGLHRLTMAVVNGRRVYRVMAGGFATKAQAATVCKALAQQSARCFVRRRDLAE